MEGLILFSLNLPHPQERIRRLIEQNGFSFDEYYSGFTLATIIVLRTVPLQGALYLALVAGDLMAKEVEEGTMRMLLCRPISRIRVTMLKFLAGLVHTFALVVFIGITALMAGLAYRGTGGLFIFEPEAGVFALIPPEHALPLYALAIPLLALSMVSISSIGFLFSCCNMKPATASIVTVSIILLDFIFSLIPYFESLRPLFITTHLSAWIHIFEYHPPWPKMLEDYSYLIGLDITCLILGTAIFYQRDLK
jgi:ABC-2 type transport system permease protein